MTSRLRYRLDDLVVDGVRREVRRGRRRIALPALSFDTLWALTAAGNDVVTFEALIEQAWRGAVVSNETVSQRIRLLRRELGDEARNARYIESVRGHGYRLVPEVHTMDDAAISRRRLIVAAAVVMLTGSLALLGSWHVGDRPEIVERIAGPPSVEELVARGWIYLDRHQRQDNRLAWDLFERALALDPELAEARWGESLALSQAVAKFDAPVALAGDAGRLAREVIADSSHDYRGHLALAASLDARGRVTEAIAAYEQALALAPEHHGIRASLAYLYQVRGRLVEALEMTLAAMQGARLHYAGLQVAETLRLLGFHAAAEPWLLRAESLQPDNVFAPSTLVRHLMAARRFEGAREVIDRAVAREVRRAELHKLAGVLALIEGDPQAADTRFREALKVDAEHGPASAWLTVVGLLTGTIERSEYRHQVDAIEAAIAAGDEWPDNFRMLADLHAAAGEPKRAVAALERLVDAGFRDSRLLRVWPTLQALQGEPGFEAVLTRIEADVERQRATVLAAGWVSPELLTAAMPAAHSP